MEMAFAILTEVTGDVVGHLTRYGRVGGCRCHVLPQLRRLVCLPLGLEDVISFSDFSAFTLAKYLSLMFSSKFLLKTLPTPLLPEGGVTLAPHDPDVGAVLGERLLLGLGPILAEPSLGTPRRCAQPRQS